MCHKQTAKHKLSYFSLKAISKTILRMENIGQICHKHKIREIFNCDMTKVLEQISRKKHYPIPNIILIPNVKFQMKL